MARLNTQWNSTDIAAIPTTKKSLKVKKSSLARPVIGKEFEFEMAMSVYGLIKLLGIDDMNTAASTAFLDKYGWDSGMDINDLSFDAKKVDRNGNVVIMVHGVIIPSNIS